MAQTFCTKEKCLPPSPQKIRLPLPLNLSSSSSHTPQSLSSSSSLHPPSTADDGALPRLRGATLSLHPPLDLCVAVNLSAGWLPLLGRVYSALRPRFPQVRRFPHHRSLLWSSAAASALADTDLFVFDEKGNAFLEKEGKMVRASACYKWERGFFNGIEEHWELVLLGSNGSVVMWQNFDYATKH
ncbi:hypothetical protein PIB30_009992 [Stylosanthes scabra]|uniref:Uncharacterized protein n=1 Tax=Stylosanthes scabra TaxID=79078 RepID=A0ABU6U499_9FABA|nr:hypothetical protein [Stylosanthes scabra]